LRSLTPADLPPAVASVVHRFSFTDFNGRSHEKLFSTAELAEAERTRVLQQLLSDALPVKHLEDGRLVLPLLPLPEDYMEAGPLGGLVYEDFPELSQVIHVLASATVEELLVMDELSDT
jgi:hypothetical protein